MKLKATLPLLIILGCFALGGCPSDSHDDHDHHDHDHGHDHDHDHGSGDGNKLASQVNELKIEVLEEGSGPAAEAGDTLHVTYSGKLADGTEFDTNDKPGGTPFVVTLGQGRVIKGWDQGLVGTKAGSTVKLSIPPELGYGEKGSPPKIPANADLFFEITVHHIAKPSQETYAFEDVKEGTGRTVKEGDTVTIDYVGTLLNGKVFDSTERLKQSFTFTVGKNEAISGIDRGVIGMKKGGIRRLRVPPKFAYGMRGKPPRIPPQNILDFEVTLNEIK